MGLRDGQYYVAGGELPIRRERRARARDQVRWEQRLDHRPRKTVPKIHGVLLRFLRGCCRSLRPLIRPTAAGRAPATSSAIRQGGHGAAEDRSSGVGSSRLRQTARGNRGEMVSPCVPQGVPSVAERLNGTDWRFSQVFCLTLRRSAPIGASYTRGSDGRMKRATSARAMTPRPTHMRISRLLRAPQAQMAKPTALSVRRRRRIALRVTSAPASGRRTSGPRRGSRRSAALRHW